MRISDSSFYARFLAGLDAQREALSRAVDQVSDGKRVRVASDDPVGAHASLALRGRIVQLEGYDKSAQAARSDLATMDSILGEVTNVLNTARAEAMAGSSGVTGSQNQARAETIDGLRRQLLSLVNAQQSGRYLFGGTATTAPPFADDGTFSGNDAEVEAPVDTSETVGATVSGRRAFQGAVDILQTLTDLADDLRNNRVDDVSASVITLKQAIDQVSEVRADVGSRMSRIDAVLVKHEDEATRIAKRISEIEDVNLEQAIVDLQAADTARSALSASASRVLGKSLFDYMG